MEKHLSVEERLTNIEAMLVFLVGQNAPKGFYDIFEFARIVGRSCYTCRQWCLLGRVRAVKKQSGRGAYASWAVSHEEVLRYQREGLLPVQRSG